jgi:predicted transcriptional regulator
VTRGPDRDVDGIDVLHEFVISPDPAFVPAEIGDSLGVTKETARNRMNELVDLGLLEKKKPGQRTVLYWITKEGREHYQQNASEP